MADKTVVALYDRFEDAREAVDDLVQAGIAKDRIALLANNVDGRHPEPRTNPAFAERDADDPEAKAMTPPIIGAEIGGGVGGIVGLLVGAGAFAIPGIGPVVALGWWAPLVAGLGAGAAVGGAIGAFADGGVADKDAHLYAEGIRRGGTLVCARLTDDQLDRTTQILKAHGAIDIEKRGASWKAAGWTSFDEKAQPLSAAELASLRDWHIAAGHEAEHHHVIRHYFRPGQTQKISGGATNEQTNYAKEEAGF